MQNCSTSLWEKPWHSNSFTVSTTISKFKHLIYPSPYRAKEPNQNDVAALQVTLRSLSSCRGTPGNFIFVLFSRQIPLSTLKATEQWKAADQVPVGVASETLWLMSSPCFPFICTRCRWNDQERDTLRKLGTKKHEVCELRKQWDIFFEKKAVRYIY